MYRAALRHEVWFIVTWAILGAAFGAGTVLAFDPFRGATDLRASIAGLPAPVIAFLGLGDLGNWSGFVDALLFGLLAPVAFLSFSIGFGTRAGVAREDRGAGTDAVQGATGSLPAASKIILLKMAALVSGNLLMGIAMVAGVLMAAAVASVVIAPANLVSAVLADMALGVIFGVIGLLAAMLAGRIGLAVVIATIAALVADTLNGIAPAVPALTDMRYLSPVYYAEAGRPIADGVTLAHLCVLLGVMLAVIAATVFAANTSSGRRSGA